MSLFRYLALSDCFYNDDAIATVTVIIFNYAKLNIISIMINRKFIDVNMVKVTPLLEEAKYNLMNINSSSCRC